MLNLTELRVARGKGSERHEVHLPELALAAGQVAAIVGPSGCGKSTLLEVLGLLLTPTTLSSFTLGPQQTNVAALLHASDEYSLAEIRSRDIGFLLQSGGLLPFLSVRDNIALPRLLMGLPQQSERVDHACATLGLEPLLDKRPGALSIGERQRTAFVRAMAHEPRLLLADEPTAALDPTSGERLFGLIVSLVKELDMAALVVSHDYTLVAQFKLPRLTASLTPGGCRFAFAH
ncbi:MULTISPECIES: ABC transporter ATP-binding protein [unclassified Halomonas]|uniref:ABC transporter ATP-binding protein n=1 Tax=unclassified Halomonas TaxID=2609666 RepID=UPI0007D8F9AA|nr:MULTISPECIES: ABC transporter ATP-binding protein [unclassified Halomonas]MBT2786396.1 ABC transporter ATP-binding protein [Halomonas sp. ISL-106]MBT2797418.1 ABC transporter ATP-binding protein [Halomonas sp. ISL-104]OAL58782.1 ABC transporter ATP-binding protein [Halomonas sp. ALS9]